MAATIDAPRINEQRLPHRLDRGIASRAAIGLIVLATDQTLEHECRLLLDLPGVAFYESRILNDAAITPETLLAMEARLADGGGPDPAGPAARRRGLRLHVRLNGDRRGAGVRADPRGSPGDRLHDPDHGGLRRFPGAGRAAHGAAHALPGRHQPLHAGLHRGARLRSAGDGLVQRGGRPAGRAHRSGLDPRRRAQARPLGARSTASSSPARACAWSRRSPASRPSSKSL